MLSTNRFTVFYCSHLAYSGSGPPRSEGRVAQSSIWGDQKMDPALWTSFLLPVVPSSLDRSYTNSSISIYNKNRCIADINVDVYCILWPLSCGSPSALCFFRKMFSVQTGFDGLRTEAVKTVQTVTLSEADNVCDFWLEINLIWFWNINKNNERTFAGITKLHFFVSSVFS